MTDFIVTRPSRGTDTLHVAGCKNVHHRATFQPLEEAAFGLYPTLWRRIDEECVSTPGLETRACSQWDKVREEWDAEQARKKVEHDAHYYALWLKRRADELEYLHAFMPMRDALATLYPAVKVSAEMSTADWKFHPSIDFDPEVWRHNIETTHDRATGRLTLGRIGNIGGLINSSADAYRFGSALSIIENFVAKPF